MWFMKKYLEKIISKKDLTEQEAQEAGLYEQIGRLKMELEWLKKKAARYN